MIRSKSEIIYEYKTAKRPDEQIKILAELEGVHPFIICNILYSAGMLDYGLKRGTQARQYNVCWMIKEGFTQKEIHECLGVREQTIRDIKRSHQYDMDLIDCADERSGNDSDVEISRLQEKINNQEKTIEFLLNEKKDGEEAIKLLQEEIGKLKRKIS